VPVEKQRDRNQRLLKEYREETNPRKKSRLEGQIVQENMPFVKMKVAKFLVRSHVDIDSEDALQAGAIGLMTAVRKDKSKSAFTTYAHWWIMHELQSLAAKTQPVHRPKGAGMPYKQFRMAEAIQAATNEEATDEQLGVKPGTVDEWKQSPVFFPLDDCNENETRKSTQDKLASDSPSVEETLEQLEQEELLSLALDTLSPKMRAELEAVFVEGRKVADPEALDQALARLRDFVLDMTE